MRLKSLRRTFIGDRAFYAMVMAIVLPIMVQNAITSFVNLLDNVMVGRVGTDQMTGVSIANQLMFVCNLCVFGGMSGAGIFAAQYHGARDPKGVRNCFRFKLYLALGLTALAVAVFLLAGEPLIKLFLNEEGADGRIASTLGYGMAYLRAMLFGIAPFALSQVYASTLRETGETSLPMTAGIVAVIVNLVFNYIFIYGKLGAPAMGVVGAALATCLSRYVELAIIVVVTHSHPERYPFIVGAYRSLRVPAALTRRIIVKGLPLLLNETIWSVGISVLARCYSERGLDVVAAMNISNTVTNLFNIVFLSMGNSVAIILGQELGAGDVSVAKDHCWKLIAFTVALSLVTAVALVIFSPMLPQLYNTEQAIRMLATQFMLVGALHMPINAVNNSTYFTLRSGGKTMITFFFDSGSVWLVSIPIALLLVRCTGLGIVAIYLLVNLADLLKNLLGITLVHKGIWLNNMVEV